MTQTHAEDRRTSAAAAQCLSVISGGGGATKARPILSSLLCGLRSASPFAHPSITAAAAAFFGVCCSVCLIPFQIGPNSFNHSARKQRRELKLKCSVGRKETVAVVNDSLPPRFYSIFAPFSVRGEARFH